MTIRCPHCAKGLKLTQPVSEGTSLTCPACRQPFVVDAGMMQPSEPPPVASPAEEVGEIPNLVIDDAESSWASRVKGSKRSRGKSTHRKPAKRAARGRSTGSKNPWLIGGGILGIAALTVLGVVLFFGGSDPEPEEIIIAGDDTSINEERPGDDDGLGREGNVVPFSNPIAPKVKLAGANAPEPPPGGDGTQLNPDVLARVKKATVMLRVTDSTGSHGTGSGFFAIDKRIIVTNAHVVGMLPPGSQKPLSVEVVVDSGLADERKLPARVTAVDRNSDLAVVQLQNESPAEELPEPLKVYSARKLLETQRVFVSGFPFGEGLGKNIAIRGSSVSSLRLNKSGELKRVQVEGGMSPGNSGGPVVDSNGSVVGIAVAGIPGTQINFAVPGDSLYRMLNGRIEGVTLGDVKQIDKEFWLKVTVHTVDPLERLENVAVDWWVGDKGEPYEPSTSPAKPRPGDSKRTTVPLLYSDGVATGTLTIPPVPEGKTIYIQPACESKTGAKHWMMSVGYDPGPLLKSDMLVLAQQPRKGTSDLYLTSDTVMKVDYFRGLETTLTSRLKTRLVETTSQVTPLATRKELSIARVDWDVRTNDRKSSDVDSRRETLKYLKAMTVAIDEDRHGAPKKAEIKLPKVPGEEKDVVETLSRQLVDSLDLVTVPTPGREMVADTDWEAIRRAPFSLPGAYASGPMAMTYTYQGVGTYYGHKVAVIRIRGSIPTLATEQIHLSSKAQGKAYYDLAGKRMLVAELTLDINLHARVGTDRAKAVGQTRIRLSRIPPK